MTQYSAFFISLVTIAILWASGNDTVMMIAAGICLTAALLSLTSYAFAVRSARDRRSKVVAGMKLRQQSAKDTRRAGRSALKVVDGDYDFVPAWITYIGMGLALSSILLLAYAVVIRFLIPYI